MYPLTCSGGYPMPLTGKMVCIYAVTATVDDLGADARLTLIDDLGLSDSEKFGRPLTDSSGQDTKICELRSIANTEGMLKIKFDSPVKLRRQLSVSYADNVVAGSIFVYVK